VQSLPSSQLIGVPAQVVPVQKSLSVHGSPSSHPRTAGVCTHVVPLHESSVHGFMSSQPEFTHAPPQHDSLVEQRVPRVQVEPTHVAVSHVPAVGAQFVPSQVVPLGWQPCIASQCDPPAHSVLLATCAQPAGEVHESTVHATPSSQPFDTPATQCPPPQESPIVHGLPSSHVEALSECVQPCAGSHASVVHAFVSSQLMCAPGVHMPLVAQVPAPEQRSCASQGPVNGSWWQLPVPQ
jgi:hypothetical protein